MHSLRREWYCSCETSSPVLEGLGTVDRMPVTRPDKLPPSLNALVDSWIISIALKRVSRLYIPLSKERTILYLRVREIRIFFRVVQEAMLKELNLAIVIALV